MTKLFISSIFILFTLQLLACQPSWVKAMACNDVDYFVTTKRFDNYWKHHFKPNEEEEEYSSSEKIEGEQITEEEREGNDPRRLLVKIFQSEEHAKEKSNSLLISYKNFNKWRMEMLPYVKSDGSILSPDERIAAWKQLNNM